MEEKQVPSREQLVTKAHLTAVLKADKGEDAELVSWNIEGLTKKGENAMFLVKCVKVKFLKDGKEQDASYVVKITPDNMEGFEELIEVFAEKEAEFYTNMVPKLMTELTAAGEPSLRIPKCFHTQTQKGQEVLYLEDMRLKGYVTSDRRKGLDAAHTTLVMKELARFHASSVLWQRKLERSLGDKYDFLLVDWTHLVEKENGGFKMMWAGNLEMPIALLNHVGGYEKVVKWIKENKYRSEEILAEMMTSSPPFNVICQGDCWNSNTLFRYDEKGNPVDVTIIDFQNILWVSLALDLNYFLYVCLEGPVRKDNIDAFLMAYFETFRRVVEAGGVRMPFTLEELHKEYQNKHRYGLLFAMVFATFVAVEPDDFPEATDMFAVKSEEKTEVMCQKALQLFETNPKVRPRFLAVIDEMQEAGVFD